jgi:drug/metabolite transporter (DMT)-like permease
MALMSPREPLLVKIGVLGGVLLLGEPLTPSFAAAAALVGAGIYLVNSRK